MKPRDAKQIVKELADPKTTLVAQVGNQQAIVNILKKEPQYQKRAIEIIKGKIVRLDTDTAKFFGYGVGIKRATAVKETWNRLLQKIDSSPEMAL